MLALRSVTLFTFATLLSVIGATPVAGPDIVLRASECDVKEELPRALSSEFEQ